MALVSMETEGLLKRGENKDDFYTHELFVEQDLIYKYIYGLKSLFL